MNYRHIYHAGGFSDVLKHITVIILIRAMIRKEKPLCYLDTHAGSGLYDLHSEFAQKTGEFAKGVQRLFEYRQTPVGSIPASVEAYLKTIQHLGYPAYYPGSPLIAKTFLREIDRLILIELQSEEYKLLQKNVKNDPRIAVHQQDAYLSLKAFLPPAERRTLILIDPAFEQKNEWKQLLEAIKTGLKRFPTGVFAIWYPIKDLKQVKQFLKSVNGFGLSSAIVAELSIYPQDAPLSLMGSGMLIINPPWQCAEILEETLPWIWKALALEGTGSCAVQNLALI